MPIREFASKIGVSTQTIRRWEKEGKITPAYRTPSGHRMFTQEQVNQYSNRPIKDPITIAYSRVSSHSQKDDLASQKQAIEQWVINNGTVLNDHYTDIGSGLSFKRKNLQKIIDLAVVDHQPINLIVAHKDRLSRFGFDLIEHILIITGGSITVINLESLSPQEELVQDIVTILHVFSSRLYGLRKYKKQISRDKEIQNG